jgi:signal transduction histidine kinase
MDGAMPLTSPTIVRSTIALIVVGFLALLGIVGMTIWLGERAQFYFDYTIAARDVRASAVELRNALQTAEASQRGYLVTGNQIYLAPYGTAKAQAQRLLETVKRQLATREDTQAALQRLASITVEKINEMDETIALKRDRRDADALAVFRTNRGKALMDEANVFFSGIIRAADNRLTSSVAEQQSNAAKLRWVSILGGILIVVMVGSATATLVRYTRDLAVARDEVANLNISLERRVEERTADLALANDEVQRFAYIVTHDLRAPLVNIMGFTGELERGVNSLQALIDKSSADADTADPVVKEARVAANSDLPEAIDFIRSSTKKMDTLISAILKLSREGRRELRPERVDLGEIIAISTAAIRHQLSEANGELSVKLEVGTIDSDRLSLEQIFGNLLDNAVKYRSNTRPLRIRVEARAEPGDRIGIEVSDNGRGIANQDRERVFELFRRSGAQSQPGEGIGLAHVRTMVRNLGGDITMTSVLDVGTTFRIVLPLHFQAVGSPAA